MNRNSVQIIKTETEVIEQRSLDILPKFAAEPDPRGSSAASPHQNRAESRGAVVIIKSPGGITMASLAGL